MSLTSTPGGGYCKEREVCLERAVLANAFRHGGKKVYGVIVAKQWLCCYFFLPSLWHDITLNIHWSYHNLYAQKEPAIYNPFNWGLWANLKGHLLETYLGWMGCKWKGKWWKKKVTLETSSIWTPLGNLSGRHLPRLPLITSAGMNEVEQCTVYVVRLLMSWKIEVLSWLTGWAWKSESYVSSAYDTSPPSSLPCLAFIAPF